MLCRRILIDLCFRMSIRRCAAILFDDSPLARVGFPFAQRGGAPAGVGLLAQRRCRRTHRTAKRAAKYYDAGNSVRLLYSAGRARAASITILICIK